MNDFTKDELQLIQNNLSWEECQEKNRKLMEINNKLTDMISNYCEHEPSDPKLVLIKHCVKCNQHLETRQWGLHDHK